MYQSHGALLCDCGRGLRVNFAAMHHRDAVKKAHESLVANVLIVAAAVAICFSLWIVNSVLTQIALLRPTTFPRGIETKRL